MSPREREPGARERTDSPLANLTPSEEQRIDGLVRGLPRIEPSPRFEAAFWARVAGESPRTWGGEQSSWWSRLSIPLETLAAAAALALFAVWLTPSDTALPDPDWSLLADGEGFEIVLEGDLDLLASLDVVEAWDGSEGS